MKMLEIRKNSPETLREILAGMRKKLEELRFGGAGRKLKNVKEVGMIRRDIARILTALRNPV